MTKLPLDKFLELVQRCGLVDPARLTTTVAQWRSQATPAQRDDAAHCGEFLVRSGLLTAWQCHKLLEGRHRGFQLGNYKLLDHLGTGGMSNVYLAEHVLMQRRVAIKVLPQHRVADSAQLARFHFEGQAAAALDHKNIVRAYDLGSEGRIHYLVMEYIEGEDLEDLVRARGPLAYHAAADYVAQAAAGLEHAHGLGLVHRDVKPANLLVDRHQTVKILDMGLAKFKAEVKPVPAFARDEEVLGTADYLAPEQSVNSLTVDHRADIYGLGCTLYFLLTGHPPFTGRTTTELMAAHHNQAPPDIRAERPDAPAELVAICHRMMEKTADRRYQAARDVREALQRWLAGEHAAGRAGGPRDSQADVASAIRDTATDVRDTAPIVVGRPSGGATGRGSDVIVPPPAPKPPVVPPPRDSARQPIPTVVPVPAQPVGPVAASGSTSVVERPTSSPVSYSRREPGRAIWPWVVALSGLVIVALVLAVFAFGS
jgi:serine/threonine-protein kinase